MGEQMKMMEHQPHARWGTVVNYLVGENWEDKAEH